MSSHVEIGTQTPDQREAVYRLQQDLGYWGEHPDHLVEDWIDEVIEDATRLGYWEWVANRIQADPR